MGFGLHALATYHTFARENLLGAFLLRFIKLGFLDIPGEYPMLLDYLAEKASVIAVELRHRVSVILTLCVIFLLSTSTRSRYV